MTLPLLVDMAVADHGERVAIGSHDRGLTFADLAGAASGAAARFLDAGGGAVAYVGVHGASFPVALLGAALAGLPFTPLSYRLGGEQLARLIEALDGPLVVVDAAFVDMVTAAGASRILPTAGLAVRPDRDAKPDLPWVDGAGSAVVLFTSGTTSAPKAVVLTHDNLFSYVIQTVELGGAGADEAALVCVPPYHVAGVGAVLTNLYAGRRTVHLPEFSPAAWLDLARQERVTHAMVVPTMLARLVEYLDGQPADVSSLRSIAYGGARMPRPVIERALVAFPTTGFVNAYGLTETSSTIAVLGPDDHRAAIDSDDEAVRARLGSAGRAVPGIELVVRGDDGEPLPAGEIGELYVRGAQVSARYVGLGSSLDADGWFATRDRAWFDADGYLFVEGRADDTIIRGGENIAPGEIEEVLAAHPAVADAVVFGRPDEEWGERIAAVVVVREAVEPDDLRAWVRHRLRSSRTPQDIVFRAELPRTETGKVLRRVLITEMDGGTD